MKRRLPKKSRILFFLVLSDKISALAAKRLCSGGENDPTPDFHLRVSS